MIIAIPISIDCQIDCGNKYTIYHIIFDSCNNTAQYDCYKSPVTVKYVFFHIVNVVEFPILCHLDNSVFISSVNHVMCLLNPKVIIITGLFVGHSYRIPCCQQWLFNYVIHNMKKYSI